MLHEVDPVLFLILFKGGFHQICIKMLKHKWLLPVPLYADVIRITIQFVLLFAAITNDVNSRTIFRPIAEKP